MTELEEFTIRGEFNFATTDTLSKACNAPSKESKFGGLYIIYAEKMTSLELVYIGISGRVNKTTQKLISRKDGIRGRIVNSKRNVEPRKNYWIREMIKENINALKICWYVVHDDNLFMDCPATLERALIDKYKPRWNRK